MKKIAGSRSDPVENSFYYKLNREGRKLGCLKNKEREHGKNSNVKSV
jgi:hypothetical protein